VSVCGGVSRACRVRVVFGSCNVVSCACVSLMRMAASVIRTTASNLAGGTLDDGGLDAFDDRFTSCLLNHPNTTVVIGTTLAPTHFMLIFLVSSLFRSPWLQLHVCW
jgi:hypothetical protein